MSGTETVARLLLHVRLTARSGAGSFPASRIVADSSRMCGRNDPGVANLELETKIDVLIVDDDEGIRTLLCVALKRRNLTCLIAVDGFDALEKLRTHSVSVILVDLMMPRLDGRDFVAKLTEVERSSENRPVVLMMTAFSSSERLPVPDDRVQAVIRKPFDVLALTRLVSDCVQSLVAGSLETEPSVSNPLRNIKAGDQVN